MNIFIQIFIILIYQLRRDKGNIQNEETSLKVTTTNQGIKLKMLKGEYHRFAFLTATPNKQEKKDFCKLNELDPNTVQIGGYTTSTTDGVLKISIPYCCLVSKEEDTRIFGKVFMAKLVEPIEDLTNVHIENETSSCDIQHPANLTINVECDFTTSDPKAKLIGLCVYKKHGNQLMQVKGEPKIIEENSLSGHKNSS